MSEVEDWQDRDELTPEELAEFKASLEFERDRVLSRLKTRVEDAVGESEALPDEADQAQQFTEQAYMLRLADKEQKLLRQISRALKKFQTGEYGFCEGTGDLINPARLRIRPWTRYSIEYKEEQERERRGFARKDRNEVPRAMRAAVGRGGVEGAPPLDFDKSLQKLDSNGFDNDDAASDDDE